MKRIIYYLIPFFAVVFVIFLKTNIEGILSSMPFCVTYEKYGIYCIGCGNTRAVRALLNGDILLSVRCNPSIVFIIVIMVLMYVEGLINKKIIPGKYKFWVLIGILFIIFYIVRNFIPELFIPVF